MDKILIENRLRLIENQLKTIIEKLTDFGAFKANTTIKKSIT